MLVIRANAMEITPATTRQTKYLENLRLTTIAFNLP